MVGTVVGAVAALAERVAAPLEALAVALRHVARTVAPRHRHVAEHQQTRVPEQYWLLVVTYISWIYKL